MTPSLGVLKAKSRDMFEPKLPAEFQETIDLIGFGTVDKIFLDYPEPWWPVGHYKGFSFINKVLELLKVISFFGLG